MVVVDRRTAGVGEIADVVVVVVVAADKIAGVGGNVAVVVVVGIVELLQHIESLVLRSSHVVGHFL